MRIEIIADVKTTLGEGPLWDVEQQRLYWSDPLNGRVLRCTEDSHASVVLHNGLHDLDMATGELSLSVDPTPGLDALFVPAWQNHPFHVSPLTASHAAHCSSSMTWLRTACRSDDTPADAAMSATACQH